MEKHYFLQFLCDNFQDKLVKADNIKNIYIYKIKYNDLYKIAKKELGINYHIFKKVKDKTFYINYNNNRIQVEYDDDFDEIYSAICCHKYYLRFNVI